MARIYGALRSFKSAIRGIARGQLRLRRVFGRTKAVAAVACISTAHVQIMSQSCPEKNHALEAEFRVVCLSMELSRPEVRGVDVDEQTRCAHYRSALDVIAIKMKCCGVYYACKACHEALASHGIEVWPEAEWSQSAVLCGACGYEMTINEYMASGDRCSHCDAPFNPGCRKHYGFYFASADSDRHQGPRRR